MYWSKSKNIHFRFFMDLLYVVIWYFTRSAYVCRLWTSMLLCASPYHILILTQVYLAFHLISIPGGKVDLMVKQSLHTWMQSRRLWKCHAAKQVFWFFRYFLRAHQTFSLPWITHGFLSPPTAYTRLTPGHLCRNIFSESTGHSSWLSAASQT